jgi:hypothetical protein
MTRTLLIIIILLFQGNLIFELRSCGPFSPDYVDFQLHLFRPELFSRAPFWGFEYSYYGFDEYAESPDSAAENRTEFSRNQNIRLWASYIGNQAEESKIYFAVYNMSPDEIHPESQNDFICTLYEQGKLEATEYLKFAIAVSLLSSEESSSSDPWEKGNKASLSYRDKFIEIAQKSISTCKDAEIIRRYAFQCIRLAYYNGNSESASSCFNEYFDGHACKDIIDYWALYYIAMLEEDTSKRNFMLSQVFSNAADKMYISSHHYGKGMSIQEVLAHADSNIEKANVYVLRAFKNSGKAMDELKAIYELHPNSEALPFLVLREINKLEDWILTPYYTRAGVYRIDENKVESSIDKGLRIDRQYAANLLQWLTKIKLKDKTLWQCARIDLHFLLRNFERSIALIQTVQSDLTDENPLLYTLQKTEMMATIFKQKAEESCIPGKYQPLIKKMYAKDENKILFMLAREFEYKGHTTMAAKFFSKVNNDDNEGIDWWEIDHAFWKSRNKTESHKHYWFDDAFSYFDSQYNISQMADLISDVKRKTGKSKFDHWLDEELVQQLFKLHDLLGTMHIRKNQLSEALHAFREVPDSIWNSDDYPYNFYLNCNSFYTNLYNEHKTLPEDSIKYNKVQLTGHLINLLKKSKNLNDQNRDKYLFSIANCYLNMTYYGNSWMMRRYNRTSPGHQSNFEDYDEYYRCDLAKKYYLDAKAASKSTKFAALCLRMAGRCEKYGLMNGLRSEERQRSDYSQLNFDDYIFLQNKPYQQLKKEYPDDYQELISNCYSFGKYYALRR